MLIDTHCHLQFAAFEKDRDEVIKRALAHNIWLINVGSQKDTSRKAVEIAGQYDEGVYATVGLHPIHTQKSYYDPQEIEGDSGFVSRQEEFDYEFYRSLAQHPKVVAIGECGLDYYSILGREIKNLQKDVFIQHIKLAQDIKKPLMIHCRDAFNDLIEILKADSSPPEAGQPLAEKLKADNPGIIHFFTGSPEDARQFLAMGFSFSFGGLITFPPKAGQPQADNRNFDEIIKFIPLEKILLETDAPYVAPEPYRGKRNEPFYVVEVAKKIAEIKGISLEKVAEQTTKNAINLFNIRTS